MQSQGTEHPSGGNSKTSPGTSSTLWTSFIPFFPYKLIAIEYLDIFLIFNKLFLVSIVVSNKLYNIKSETTTA